MIYPGPPPTGPKLAKSAYFSVNYLKPGFKLENTCLCFSNVFPVFSAGLLKGKNVKRTQITHQLLQIIIHVHRKFFSFSLLMSHYYWPGTRVTTEDKVPWVV